MKVVNGEFVSLPKHYMHWHGGQTGGQVDVRNAEC